MVVHKNTKQQQIFVYAETTIRHESNQVNFYEAITNLRNGYKTTQIKRYFTTTRVSRLVVSVLNVKKQRQILFYLRSPTQAKTFMRQ